MDARTAIFGEDGMKKLKRRVSVKKIVKVLSARYKELESLESSEHNLADRCKLCNKIIRDIMPLVPHIIYVLELKSHIQLKLEFGFEE